jgi:hypothetical protein
MSLRSAVDEVDWLDMLDILYSHTCVLGDVPPRSSVVEIWMDRLVEFEVRRSASPVICF